MEDSPRLSKTLCLKEFFEKLIQTNIVRKCLNIILKIFALTIIGSVSLNGTNNAGEYFVKKNGKT